MPARTHWPGGLLFCLAAILHASGSPGQAGKDLAWIHPREGHQASGPEVGQHSTYGSGALAVAL